MCKGYEIYVRVTEINLISLAQLILLILRNLNFKPRKHKARKACLRNIIPTGSTGYETRDTTINTLLLHQKIGGKEKKKERPPCPSCNPNKVIKNGSSRGKTKYKYKTCKRTFYQTPNHKFGREQKERILKDTSCFVECLNFLKCQSH
ncbi:hypothetical protein J5U21_01719 [Saccharolobus shibatae]|uniref:Uncharacterized protein n=1 Tax=Saccharolobus shibatae TaxID=2286 RepID=A0A8F5GWD6_9CREN|nr:hypothetical protein J5U21_01719 [Saccharolobus shibatae]